MKEKPKLDITGMDMNDPPFQRYEGVLIATKVLWSKDLPRLRQMFCLLNAAYNRHHVDYNLLVFTTLPCELGVKGKLKNCKRLYHRKN